MGRKILRYAALLLIVAPLAIVLAVALAFGIDSWTHRDRVGHNVSIAGFAVADANVDDVANVLRSENAAASALPVVIRTDGLVIESTVAAVGISVDEAAVTDAALVATDGDGVVEAFRRWWRSLRGDTEIPLQFELDPTPLKRIVEEHPGRVISHPREPEFTGDGAGLEVVEPREGSYLDAADVIAAISGAVAAGPPPYTVDVASTPIPTILTSADLDGALAAADDLSARLTVSINKRIGIIGRESVRRWIDSSVVEGQLVPVFDHDRVQESVENLFADYADPLPDPKFIVDEGELHADLGVPARRCCAAGVGPLLYAAAAGDGRGVVELPTVRVEDDGGRARADEWGIAELVGTFTTNHACCAGRVANIHRIADLVRGQVIEPGETFSVNDFVGRRTRANGFVAAGVIQSGHFTDQVGGGISQFATTTFNAAFFAGLDVDEYQSHSIYISRYPYGREATLSFPLPDLELTNNTPHAAMLWPTYTGTSITVDIWSTKYFEVEQTRQTSFKIGRCTRVNTYRSRTAPDGTVIDDMYFATYRPGEGLDCAGNATPDPEG